MFSTITLQNRFFGAHDGGPAAATRSDRLTSRASIDLQQQHQRRTRRFISATAVLLAVLLTPELRLAGGRPARAGPRESPRPAPHPVLPERETGPRAGGVRLGPLARRPGIPTQRWRKRGPCPPGSRRGGAVSRGAHVGHRSGRELPGPRRVDAPASRRPSRSLRRRTSSRSSTRWQRGLVRRRQPRGETDRRSTRRTATMPRRSRPTRTTTPTAWRVSPVTRRCCTGT